MAKIGLLRPFARDEKAGLAKGAGDAPLVGRISAIIASNGELPWKPELDARIDRLRHTRNTAMLGQFASVYVQEALQRFEPTVIVLSVTASRDDATLTLTVQAQRADRILEATATLQ